MFAYSSSFNKDISNWNVENLSYWYFEDFRYRSVLNDNNIPFGLR